MIPLQKPTFHIQQLLPVQDQRIVGYLLLSLQTHQHSKEKNIRYLIGRKSYYFFVILFIDNFLYANIFLKNCFPLKIVILLMRLKVEIYIFTNYVLFNEYQKSVTKKMFEK